MPLLLKAAMTVLVVLVATSVARRMPSAAGLIGVMPLTGAMVLVWTYVESRGDAQTMERLTQGALWGILPSILFFVIAFAGFRRHLQLPAVLGMAFAAWLAAAYVHQRILR